MRAPRTALVLVSVSGAIGLGSESLQVRRRTCAEAAIEPCIDRLDVIIFAAAPRGNGQCSFEILE